MQHRIVRDGAFVASPRCRSAGAKDEDEDEGDEDEANESSYSASMAYRKEVLELRRVVQGLERARDKESKKATHSTREMQRLRAQLQAREREIRALRTRPPDSVTSGISLVGSVASADSASPRGVGRAGNTDRVTVVPMIRTPPNSAPGFRAQSPTWRLSATAAAAAAASSSSSFSPLSAASMSSSTAAASLKGSASKRSRVRATRARPAREALAEQEEHGRQTAEALERAESECERLRATVACQEDDLHRAASEIEVLACALEQRAEDLGVDGNLQTGLLYQVGFFQKEVRRMEMEVATREGAERELKREIVESQRHTRTLQDRLESAEARVKGLLEERQVVVDYLKENKAKTGRLEEEIEQLVHEREQFEAQARRAVAGEQTARIELESARAQLHRVQSRLAPTAAADVSPVGDPAFETLLRETEAEIHAGAMATERSKLLEELRHQRDRAAKLEGQLQAQTSLQTRVPALEHEISSLQGQLRRAREAARDEVSSIDVRSSAIDVRSSALGARSPASADKDLQFRQSRLEGLLKVANEAREISEREAVRLEAENARLRRELRAKEASS